MFYQTRNHYVHRRESPTVQQHQMHSRGIANGDRCDGNRHDCESDCAESTSDGYVEDCVKNDDGVNGISRAACDSQSRGNLKAFGRVRKEMRESRGEFEGEGEKKEE